MKNLRLIFIILLLAFVLSGCNRNTKASQGASADEGNQSTANTKQTADKLQVYYFHRTERCISCLTIGEYINKTIMEDYSEEMMNGKIDYKEINIDVPENKELARKFKASGSALYINAIQGDNENIQNIIEVWNWKSNEENFKKNLKQKINELLGK